MIVFKLNVFNLKRNLILILILLSYVLIAKVNSDEHFFYLINRAEKLMHINQDSAMRILKQAEHFSYTNKNIKYQAFIEKKYGDFFKNVGDYSVSTNYYLRALRGFEDLNDTINIAYTLISIGDLYRASGALETALIFFNEAYKGISLISDKRCLAKLQSRLSATCYEIYYDTSNLFNYENYQYKMPIFYPDTSKKSWLELSYIFSSTAYQNSIINKDTIIMLECLNLIGAYYKSIQNIEMAIKYFDFAIFLSKKANIIGEEALYLFNISSCYQLLGETNKAISYAEQSYLKAINNQIKTYQWLASEQLSNLHKAGGNPIKSKYYREIRDSIVNLSRSDSSKNKLEGQEKAFLKHKNKSVKKQENTIFVYLIISILISIGFFIVFLKRTKK